MLVMAPPMPTSASTGSRPSSRDRSAAIAARASASTSGETTPSRPNRSVYRTAPTSTLQRSSTRSPDPKVSWVEPPPVSNTASRPSARPIPCLTARNASRLSSSPEITSTRTCARSWISSSTAAEFEAMRSPAVPTAAIASAPSAVASSTIALIASAVRAAASGAIAPRPLEPLAEARDVGTVADHASTSRPSPRSPTWNLTEFVPTSITAYRRRPPPSSHAMPRA